MIVVVGGKYVGCKDTEKEHDGGPGLQEGKFILCGGKFREHPHSCVTGFSL